MAAPNSTTLLSLVGEEYKKLEGGKDTPFWADMPELGKWISNATEFGGGEGDGESFKIPIEIDGSITTTVSETYKASTNKQDVTIAANMSFKYQWVDQDLLLYKREADLAQDFKGLVRFRLKNAIGAYKYKIVRGMFQDDWSATTEVAGLQSLWYDTTYGGLTRSSYASRLDCASATTKFSGGNGTKFTDAIVRDGKTLYLKLIDAIWACSVNGNVVTDIYMDTLAFASIRGYLGDKFLTNYSQEGGRMSANISKPVGVLETGTRVHAVDPRLITTGHCFGITSQYAAIYSAKNAPFIPEGPFHEVDYADKNGGAKIVMFQGSGRLVHMWPTSCFWFTQFGLG